ncbi:MAG: hypothetical protein ABSF33_19965 [Acidimicrobiales bacterium]
MVQPNSSHAHRTTNMTGWAPCSVSAALHTRYAAPQTRASTTSPRITRASSLYPGGTVCAGSPGGTVCALSTGSFTR